MYKGLLPRLAGGYLGNNVFAAVMRVSCQSLTSTEKNVSCELYQIRVLNW